MPAIVPAQPTPASLARLVVGAPVSSSHGQRWALDLDYLLTGVGVAVADGVLTPLATAGGTTVYTFKYSPSPAARMLMVGVEFAKGAKNASNVGLATVTVSLSGALAGATWYSANRLDGSAPVDVTQNTQRDYTFRAGWIDLSGLAARNATGNITITVTDASPTASCKGLYRVHIAEVPGTILDPVSDPTTPGIDTAWPYAGAGGRGHLLIDGSATGSPRGFDRLFAELDVARAKVQRHWQIAAPEVQTVGVAMTTTSNAFAVPNYGWTTVDATWTLRARQLYDDATANPYVFWVRASTHNGTTSQVEILVNGSVAATASITAAAGVWQDVAKNISLPCNTTNNESQITFRFATGSGDTLYVSNLALIEAET